MKVKDLSREELKALVQEAVEEVMIELLGDPDQGLELRDEVTQRLKSSLERLKQGEEGILAEEAAKKSGLEWRDGLSS